MFLYLAIAFRRTCVCAKFLLVPDLHVIDVCRKNTGRCLFIFGFFFLKYTSSMQISPSFRVSFDSSCCSTLPLSPQLYPLARGCHRSTWRRWCPFKAIGTTNRANNRNEYANVFPKLNLPFWQSARQAAELVLVQTTLSTTTLLKNIFNFLLILLFYFDSFIITPIAITPIAITPIAITPIPLL
jgi:hypothetical protein